MNSARDYIAMFCIYGFLIAFTVGAIYLVRRDDKKKRANIAKLKAAYDQALLSKDKAQALTAGRIYYSAIRGGKFTTRDEQAIANDLSVL